MQTAYITMACTQEMDEPTCTQRPSADIGGEAAGSRMNPHDWAALKLLVLFGLGTLAIVALFYL